VLYTKDVLASCDELATKGLRLVEACLAKSPDATGLFASLGLMSTLERLMTFRAADWSTASLKAVAFCTLQHLRHAHHETPLNSSLHVAALLARWALVCLLTTSGKRTDPFPIYGRYAAGRHTGANCQMNCCSW
jgi:hypothetical protein